MPPGMSRHEHCALHEQQPIDLNIRTRKQEISDGARNLPDPATRE